MNGFSPIEPVIYSLRNLDPLCSSLMHELGLAHPWIPFRGDYLLGTHKYLWNLKQGLLKPIRKYGNAEFLQHITDENTKGTFEVNTVAVANTSIQWLNRRSLCPVCGCTEWQMRQTVLMSRAGAEGNFLFPSFSKSLSAAQPPPPSFPLLGPNTLAWVVFPPLLKQSSLTCHPALLSAVFQTTPWSSTHHGIT